MKKLIIKNHDHIQETLDGEQLQIKAVRNGKTIELDIYKTSKQVNRTVSEK